MWPISLSKGKAAAVGSAFCSLRSTGRVKVINYLLPTFYLDNLRYLRYIMKNVRAGQHSNTLIL